VSVRMAVSHARLLFKANVKRYCISLIICHSLAINLLLYTEVILRWISQRLNYSIFALSRYSLLAIPPSRQTSTI